MKKLLFLLFFGFFFSCNKSSTVESKTDSLNKPYIVSKEERKFKKYKDSLLNSKEKIMLPIKGFYGESNMLIDKNGDVYYYQNEYSPILCNYGSENDTLPEFLDLQTKDLIKIPNESLEKFVNENVMKKPQRRMVLVMASENDTIKNKVFLKFYYNLKVPTYFIRRTTQEEDTVLYYKKIDKFYFSDEIEWDKTKIKLRN